MNDSFVILVDYDNMRIRGKYRSVSETIDVVLNSIDYNLLQGYSRFIIRLYGGWYNEFSITKLAQDLSAEILSDFPRVYKLHNEDVSFSLIAQAEVVFSTKHEPNFPYLNTYRYRGLPNGLKCRHPNELECDYEKCSASGLYKNIEQGICKNTYCEHSLNELLYLKIQKIVDSIIVSDILYYALTEKSFQIIMSSDDDLWPGIRASIIYGCKVIQVHTRKSTFDSESYKRDLGEQYHQILIV